MIATGVVGRQWNERHAAPAKPSARTEPVRWDPPMSVQDRQIWFADMLILNKMGLARPGKWRRSGPG
jgi:hypothetical protein